MRAAAIALGALALAGCGAHVAGGGAAGPAALDVPARVDGDVTSATVNGLQIIVKRIPGAELVTGALFIKGGARNWGKDDAGIEKLACTVAVTGGSATMPKDVFARRLAALGSTIEATPSNAFTMVSAKGLRESWDETFALLADAFLHPALPPAEIELQRAQQVTMLRHEEESPDGRLQRLAHEVVFKGHPYENRAVGTVASVSKLGRDALVAHLARLRETHRLLFVAVGDVDAAHVIASVTAAFGTLPPGSYREAPLPSVRFAQPNLVTVEKTLPTNYVVAHFMGPTWHDPDFATGMVAMELLNWREFEEVRTKRNLSYAPHAHLDVGSELPLGTLYVTAVDPNTTVRVLFGEAKRLQDEVVPDKELEGNKAVFLTGYLMGAETTNGQAGLLGATQILAGDWRVARTLPQQVRAVNAADVQAFARKHIGKLQTVVLGNPSLIDRATFTSL